MAEIVGTAIITVLVEKISGELMNLARYKGIDSQLNKWKNMLPLIEAVLVDADQKQIRDPAVGLWLHDLHDLAYDIDDILDDLATEVMRRKFNQEFHASSSSSTSKVMKLIPSCCTNFTPRNIKYGRHMSSKLEDITAKLQELVDQKIFLGLDRNVVRSNRNNEKRLEQTSLIDESKIIGREGDKESLIVKLLENEACNENVSIVSIVGMGGIGKTTLAQLLYNDEKVKDHFELKAWVSVPEEFDVFKVSKTIFEAVTHMPPDFTSLDRLHVELKEKLSNKRFLLVLDDVWNEDHQKWKILQSPFVGGAPGSKVIVTARKTTVASAMKMDSAEVYIYNLEVLSNEKALALFAQHSIGELNFNKHLNLQPLAEDIVKKCGRLPLALITLGRVLNTKRNEDEWKELLDSEIWEDDKEIVPALKLSYNDMPSHLKQLFAYCSLFPKDYEFDKNKLVLLWMAEGFLSKSNSRKSMEKLGHGYFEELKSRSFFQHSMNNKSLYTMHDLINDLAMVVAGGFFFFLDDKIDAYDGSEAFEKFRHFSFIGRSYETYRKFKEIQRSLCLRTFLPLTVKGGGGGERFGWYALLKNIDLDIDIHIDIVKLLPRLQFLRVLSLAHCSMMEVPQSVGDLKHMRYLNFSHTYIEYVPEGVSELYNLQTLLVSHCRELHSLPVSFAKLKNLRHLDIRDTPKLKKMPLGISGLTSLQTLSKAIIEGPDNGFKISEVKGLSELQGQLSIEGLHNVRNAKEAKEANLQQKGLDEIVLQWSDVFDDSRNERNEYEVLKELRPCHMLRKLEFSNYGGKEFPNWVGSPAFDQLTEINLKRCESCTNLPKLGHLQSLERLYMRGLKKVSEFCAFPDADNDIVFPSLEYLEIADMECLEKWSICGNDNDGAATSFPRLRHFSIHGCPKLAELSVAFPSLEELEIADMECLEKWSGSGNDKDGAATPFPCLRHISIRRCPKLAELSVAFPLLEKLVITDMECLEKWSTSDDGAATSFPHLREVSIHCCPKLAEVSVGSLPALSYLYISECSELVLRRVKEAHGRVGPPKLPLLALSSALTRERFRSGFICGGEGR